MTSLLAAFPRLSFLAGFGFFAVVILRDRPRALVAVWLTTICFVPWWTGVTFHSFFPIAVLISLFTFVCLQPVVIRRISTLDWAALGFFVVCLLPTFLSTATEASTYGIAFVWAPAYLVGRTLTPRTDVTWIYGCVAVLFTAVSTLAILEFLLNWNPSSASTPWPVRRLICGRGASSGAAASGWRGHSVIRSHWGPRSPWQCRWPWPAASDCLSAWRRSA